MVSKPIVGRIKKTFTPIGNWVALQVIKQDESPGGVILPDTINTPTRTPQAWVIAVGPECKQVKEGDLIITGLHVPGQAICVSGKLEDKIIMVAEPQIAGIMDRPQEA